MLGTQLMAPLRAIATLALCVGIAAPGWAQDRILTDGEDLAIRGYDPVAYFTLGEPTPGDPAFETEWHGARWWFVSAEHEALFEADPDRYAPRYGGYCAAAMFLGRRGMADPEAWEIIDGRLYLAYSQQDIDEFTADAGHRIPVADDNWQTLGQ